MPLSTEPWHIAVSPERGLLAHRGRVAGVLITSAVTCAAFARWDAGAAFFLGLLAASVTGLIDGRVSVLAGLLGIALCPFLVLAQQESWLQQSSLVNYYAASAGLFTLDYAADQVAVWAYYFLCIGVAAQAAQYTIRGARRGQSGE
jgi:hypothetical protein